MDGRKNNGGHSTKGKAGRKPKSEELELVKLGKDAIIGAYGSEEEYWLYLAKESKDCKYTRKMITEYVYGKPKETKDLNITNAVPVVDMSEWK